jgi:hypothetical protein
MSARSPKNLNQEKQKGKQLKKLKKQKDDSLYDSDDNSEENVLDHMIGDLETTITKNQATTNKRKLSAKSSLIPSLKEFEDNEAAEEKQKKKPRSENEGTDISSKKVSKALG